MATNNGLNAPLPLALTQGGTGATSAGSARTALGLNIGSNIQAYSSYLDAIAAGNFTGFRNKLINGDFRAAQRGTSFTSVADGTYTLDRWVYNKSGVGVHTISQDADSPTYAQSGVYTTTCLKAQVTTDDNTGSNTRLYTISQYIEGYQAQSLLNGTSTLSFWVKTNVGTTYSVVFQDSTSSVSYITTYNVSSPNSWVKYSVNLASSPLSSSGTFSTSNGIGLKIIFVLSSGTTLQSATTSSWISGSFKGGSTAQGNSLTVIGNTFRLAQVQLEAGNVITPYELLPYQTLLNMCYRYCELSNCAGTLLAANTTIVQGGLTFIEKRSSPTISLLGVATVTDGQSGFTQSSASIAIVGGTSLTTTYACVNFNNFTGLATFRPYNLNVTSNLILITAEL